MKRNIAAIFILILLVSCQKILFDRQMPIGAPDILEFPKKFDGSYLSLHFADYSVSAEIHRVDRLSDFEIVVYSQRHDFIDSLYLEKRKLSTVDTAWFEDNLIYIKTGQSVQTFALNDTLSSEKEKVEISIDFNHMLYWEVMQDTSFFKISFINDCYYLKVEKLPKLFRITQLKFLDDDINIKSLDFGIVDSINPTDKFIEKYQLKPIREERGKFYIQNYLFNLNNEEFYELIHDEDVFQSVMWYKIKSSNSNTFWLVGIALSLLILIIAINKRKDNRVGVSAAK